MRTLSRLSEGWSALIFFWTGFFSGPTRRVLAYLGFASNYYLRFSLARPPRFCKFPTLAPNFLSYYLSGPLLWMVSLLYPATAELIFEFLKVVALSLWFLWWSFLPPYWPRVETGPAPDLALYKANLIIRNISKWVLLNLLF